MRSILKSITSLILAITVALPGQMIYAEETEKETVTVEAVAEYPEPPEVSAKSGIVIDLDTGAVLYEKNIHDQMYPASITKIVTALLAIEKCGMDDTFTFTADIINQLPWDAAKYGYVPGEKVNIRDLLYVLMLRSANEVAIGLGIQISGSEAEFGKLMTERAKEAGALNTNFTNASGLHDDNHYTTAYDMAMIAKEAMKNATFAQVWGQESYVVNPTNVEPDVVRIWNRHDMLVKTRLDYYSYAKGGKTGYTDEAGRTLVTYASKDGMNLLCVVMKSASDKVFSDSRALFEYSFNNFKNVKVKDNETRFGQAEDSFFVSRYNLFGEASNLLELGTGYITIPKNVTLDEVGYELVYRDGDKDNIIADIRYKIGEHYLGETTIKLNTTKDDNVELSPYKQEEATPQEEKDELPINIWWIAGCIVVIIIIIFIARILKKTKSKRKAKKERKKRFKHNKLH